MKYFAYGSNLLTVRLQERAPSAAPLGVAQLLHHELRFHKAGRDGSAKCDAFFTGCPGHAVMGVVFEIDVDDKPALDRAEGLGRGYREVSVQLTRPEGDALPEAFTYRAEPGSIDPALLPFGWYKAIVLAGAREHGLPEPYLARIEAVAERVDPDAVRVGKALRLLRSG